MHAVSLVAARAIAAGAWLWETVVSAAKRASVSAGWPLWTWVGSGRARRPGEVHPRRAQRSRSWGPGPDVCPRP